MVYAMIIVFLLFYFFTVHFQIITTSNFTDNCVFSSNTYLLNAAILNQFVFPNSTSVVLTGGYSFLSLPLTISSFQVGLIYPFPPSYDLIPFPIILNCSSVVRSCRMKTVQGSIAASRDAEPITIALQRINFTSTSISFNQMGLYLKPGQYILSNCSLDNGETVTSPGTIFNLDIQYEKSIGDSCNPSFVNMCGSPSLTTCSSTTFTCSCLPSSSSVVYINGTYCADTLNSSNCTIFPTRCVTWCNSTTNSLCICPMDTLKIRRNNVYVCELSVNALNCSTNDTIRRCPYGQSCINGQCSDIIVTTGSTSASTDNTNDSTDQRLRIALGVIAGLLGTSVLVLLGVFFWLRHRRSRRRINAEKSLSSSPVSSTSSIYISPVRQDDEKYEKFSSANGVYRLPLENDTRIFSPVYRTDSFRQAVLSGTRRPSQITEYVSTKRDSFNGATSYKNDYFGSPTYSTLDFIVPSETLKNSRNFDRNNNIYQVIVPSTPSTILTHTV